MEKVSTVVLVKREQILAGKKTEGRRERMIESGLLLLMVEYNPFMVLHDHLEVVTKLLPRFART